MTRLTENDILGLGQAINSYYDELARKVGLTMSEIACFAAGIKEHELYQATREKHVSVVPVTVGEGIIGGFSHSVQSIIKELGFNVHVSSETDVTGLAEVINNGTDIAFLADDQRFIAINFNTSTVIDNAEATARGYVSALNGMANGLKGQDVLVIGAGRVGIKAIDFLRELGANAVAFEVDPNKILYLKKDLEIKCEQNIFEALPKYKYIIESSPKPDYIDIKYLHPEVMIAAPGIPLGINSQTFKEIEERLIHDPLQIGVATMLAMAVKEKKS